MVATTTSMRLNPPRDTIPENAHRPPAEWSLFATLMAKRLRGVRPDWPDPPRVPSALTADQLQTGLPFVVAVSVAPYVSVQVAVPLVRTAEN